MNHKAINDTITTIFEPFLFNSQEYASAQTCTEGSIFLYEKDAKQVFIRLYKKGAALVSPWRAPFGGLEFSTETDLQTVYNFVKDIIAKVKSEYLDIKQITIVAPPECYTMVKADIVDEALIHAGFSVTVTELNYHLDTSNGDFESAIDPAEKRKITKCIEAGFVCEEVLTYDAAEIHKFIKDCRERKGHPLSMNVDDFKKTFSDFPEKYKLFVVKDQDTIIATAVGVVVNSEILYNFLGADHEAYLSYSPTVLLNKEMYEYSRAHGYKIYDLGIGTAGGIRNEGLIRFKEHIGGILSHKYTYELNF